MRTTAAASEAEGQQAQRCALADTVAILSIERTGVASGILGGPVLLRGSRSTVTRAFPAHRAAIGPEAVTVPEYTTGEHGSPYPRAACLEHRADGHDGRMSADAGTIETNIPARIDRLPWARFHWMVVMGLGTVWILDGLEVTIVGSVAARLTQHGSGISITAGGIGTAAAIYVSGACLGALFFGQLTDRFGRKRLFILTLGVYIIATVATAFAFAPWYLYLARFFTGAGIGGEYSAINSAIDELIPARVRGRVDLMINGSYWVGAALGSVAALIFLNTDLFAKDFGWRLAFGCGALLGVTILFVRRNVPESPRWLFIHGREEEAEAIITSIERALEQETGEKLSMPDETITVRQRKTVPFREIARVAFSKYPKRAILCLALFVGQAFLYNAITFDLGTILTTYFDVASGAVPYFLVIFAVGNLLGPLLLGRFFDTIGRRIMVSVCYLGSAAAGVALVFFLLGGSHSKWIFIGLVGVTFFLASAGASSAYLTVSEIFPMETRALAIAFFYAVGTAVGGITGPLLFGHLIDSGNRSTLAIGFVIGAVVMALGGLAEMFFGVDAEGKSLETIAEPLSAADGSRTSDRAAARKSRSTTGARRYRPGRGRLPAFSPRMSVSSYGNHDAELEREIDAIASLLEVKGPLGRDELSRALHARQWGPGRLREALRAGVEEGAIRQAERGRYTASSASGSTPATPGAPRPA
jgi:MFS family permease